MPKVTDTKYLVMAGWDDVPHLTEQAKQELLDSTPEHLKAARSKGIPTMGSGLIFPIDEKSIVVPPMQIPGYWAQIIGVDFGTDHPFAAVWLAWDRDNDVIYVTNVYKESDSSRCCILRRLDRALAGNGCPWLGHTMAYSVKRLVSRWRLWQSNTAILG